MMDSRKVVFLFLMLSCFRDMCTASMKKDRKYKDCTEILDKTETKLKSGVFKIHPDETKSVQVYCDMTTDRGGWTVIQRRMDDSVNFQRKWPWLDCENGFWDITREFWIGNELIHTLTSSGQYELRIDMYDTKKYKNFAVYKTFIIGDAASKYKLTVGDYSGNADNILVSSNGMKFTTIDQDNDNLENGNCARLNRGSWWYSQCVGSDLSSRYGPIWGGYTDINSTSMMIRKLSVVFHRKINRDF